MSLQTSLPQGIVVAIYESDPSFKALNYATRLAALTKSRVVVMNVTLLPPGKFE